VFLVTLWFAPPGFLSSFPHPLWTLAFACLGSAILGILGLIAGICAEKFDQVAAFQNFLILPLTFLSGVFYSIHSLPPFWQQVSHFNPFFYMIDGFRYGFLGRSDVAPTFSLIVVGAAALALSLFTLLLLKRGYRIRHCLPANCRNSATLARPLPVSVRRSRITTTHIMVTNESIERSIAAGLPCTHVVVDGDGHHFQAVVVSEKFAGLSRIRQHQLVYAALGDRMREEIHALSLQTYTPEAFAATGGSVG
jgi:acid stress-induced BolA-like protein IbaG/YrbA